jgi:hypothetical protein
MVNVRDFGALGNGSHDDTPNIQAAIDNTALSGLPDKGVYFPAGDYKVTIQAAASTALSLRDGMHIFGDGSKSRIFAVLPPVMVPVIPPYFNIFEFIGNYRNLMRLLLLKV